MHFVPMLRRKCDRKDRRRGLVAVQIAVSMTVIIGFAALTIDVGAMYNAKADLQRTADAAALAAAAKLADFSNPSVTPMELARAEAARYTRDNRVYGQEVEQMELDSADVEFGRAVYNTSTSSYDFVPSNTLPDSVRVRVRMTEESENRALSLYFARIFGRDTKNLTAEAVAMLVPRDIAVVADLSASHTDDSELGYYDEMADGSAINLYDVWESFPDGDGVDDGVGLEGGAGLGGSSGYSGGGGLAGPAWGYMEQLGFGTQVVDSSYNPSSDTGLLRLPQYQNWSNSTLVTALSNRGYITAEINAIMSSSYDGDGAWDERVAVALGLARWDSGIPGGLWQQLGVPASQAGNNNAWLGTGELTWQETIGDRSMNASKDIWVDYIDNYMNKTWSQMYRANSAFRYRFGIKTFINYLMERRPQHSLTPELAQARTQPMQAVKDSVTHLVDTLTALESNDHLSLEVYDTAGHHEVDLTSNFDAVSNRLNEMQAGHYDVWTNVGGGILRAREELSSSRARPTARKVIFLMTDGNANVTSTGQTGNNSGGAAYASAQAALAVADGIRIFTVSVGFAADQTLMQNIATMGSGTHFHAEGTIGDYSAQLEQIFQSLGGGRPVELIR